VRQTPRPSSPDGQADTRRSESDPVRLQDLIRTRKAALGMTYDELVAQAEAAGHPIARSTLHFIALQEWKNIPSTDTILAVAAAIGVEPDEVLNAAAASVGIQTRFMEFDHGTRAVIGLLENRTPDQIRALEDVLRSVTRAMDTPTAE
jgi:hypothetical protein